VAPSTTAAQWCSHLPASTISSIVGDPVRLAEAYEEKHTTVECIYDGAVEVLVTKETGIPKADLATRAAAEKSIASGFPKGTKIKFSPLPELGSTAFTFSVTENGGKFIGAGDNKGTTGYGALISGSPAVSKLVRLLELGFAA
jgi:hypothetical protein